MSNLYFQPEDFSSVLNLSELSQYIENIIIDIRRNNKSGSQLREKIEKLEALNLKELTVNSDIQTLLKAYENIKEISMELRKMLSHFINLEVYDSIGYVFYYNGKRYKTENISADWLLKNSKGELRLDLEKATKEIEQRANYIGKQKVNDLFNQHYESYLSAILGMYHIPKDGKRKLNKGHIAEAYESHIASHHSAAYQLLNDDNVLSVADKALASISQELISSNWWADHEDPNEAWIHIRGALGTQRGTVAGDVGRFQVKQGSNNSSYGNLVRLSSLTNLKRGISDYCKILAPESQEPAKKVARQIAMYLSEPVSKVGAEAIANQLNKEIGAEFDKIRHI